MAEVVITVVDFETCGMEPPAAVVEVGLCDLIQRDGVWTVGEPESWLCGADEIPPEVRAVHHISAAEVRGLAPFDPVALVQSLDSRAALAAHNAEFEARWLQCDGVMPLLCTLKAAYRVWPEAPGHSNSVLRYWLEDQGKLSLDNAKAMPPHRAGPDAYVTAHILKALLEAGATGKDMAAWTREPRALPRCPIGDPWRGKPWAEVDIGFVRWITTKPGMDADIVWNARRELERRASQ